MTELVAPGSTVVPARFARDLAIVVAVGLTGIAVRYIAYVLTQSGDGSISAYVEAMCVWDCGWYRSIAEGGYDLVPGARFRPGAANWAFFPLSPLIAGFVSRITAIPVVLCGFLLSNAYAITAAAAARPLFAANTRAYWLYVVMLLAGSFSFLFSSLHTEALFILLTTLALVAIRRGDPLVAGGWTALLSATRLTGVILAAGIVIGRVADYVRDGVRLRDMPLRALTDSRFILGVTIAPLGLVLYGGFLRLHVGDGLAFLHIQRAWGRTVANPVETFTQLAQAVFPVTTGSMLVAVWLSAAVVGLALSGILAWRRRYAEAVFCAGCILVSLSGGATSMVRFVAGLAPLGIVTAELLSAWPPLYYLAFPAMIVIGVFTSIGWMNSSLFAM